MRDASRDDRADHEQKSEGCCIDDDTAAVRVIIITMQFTKETVAKSKEQSFFSDGIALLLSFVFHQVSVEITLACNKMDEMKC